MLSKVKRVTVVLVLVAAAGVLALFFGPGEEASASLPGWVCWSSVSPTETSACIPGIKPTYPFASTQHTHVHAFPSGYCLAQVACPDGSTRECQAPLGYKCIAKYDATEQFVKCAGTVNLCS